MNAIMKLLLGLLIFAGPTWCLEQDLGVFAAGSEVGYSEYDTPGTAPLLEGGGFSYGLAVKYFRSSASVGIGRFRDNSSFTARAAGGPKIDLFARKLEIGLDFGVGYLGRYDSESSFGPKPAETFKSEVATSASLGGALFKRLDIAWEQYWNSHYWWRLKMGVRLLRF